MIITIIDLGINNLTSVLKSFGSSMDKSDKLNIASQAEDSQRPDLIILPGLGKFAAGMHELTIRGLHLAIHNWVKQGSKLAGICLGMQLLGDSSEESPGIEGLKLISGTSSKLKSEVNEKVPNIGWREVSGINPEIFFKSLNSNPDFYFVHSYHFKPLDSLETLATSTFGKSSFVSAIKKDNVCGFQFHPEKSGNNGKVLINETLDWARSED
jgi:glutamine amidotransferase